MAGADVEERAIRTSFFRSSCRLPRLPSVRTLIDVLASPGLEGLTVLTEGGLHRPIAAVRLVESIHDLENSAGDCFTILTASATRDLTSYRFDVAVRRASAAGVTAFAVPVPAEIPPTSRALADRGRVSLITVPEGADLAELIVAIARGIAGGSEIAVAGLHRCLEALGAAEAAGDEAAVLDAVRALVPDAEVRIKPKGVAASLVDSATGEASAAPFDGEALDVAARAALALGAGALGRVRSAARRAEEAPVRSVAELLTELLAADPARSPRLLNRARSLGLPIDGWHVVARIEVEEAGADEVAAFELQETVAHLALGTARSSGGAWHVARSESAVLLIRMWDEDPGPAAAGRVTRVVGRAVASLRERLPGREVRGGVGSVHEGPTGLRASAAEARATIGTARTAGRDGDVLSYDVVGLRRMLLEWYASDTARDSVRSLLSPLEALGPQKAETAIRTLQVYLDEQGSIARSARALYLHRNAVTYRIKRIADSLDADLDDPDLRLALQLACRARLLS